MLRGMRIPGLVVGLAGWAGWSARYGGSALFESLAPPSVWPLARFRCSDSRYNTCRLAPIPMDPEIG